RPQHLAPARGLPESGKVFISVRDADKPSAVAIAHDLVALGFQLVATRGTASALAADGLAVLPINKVAEGRAHVVDMIQNGDVALILTTVEETRTARGRTRRAGGDSGAAARDSSAIRRAALQARITLYTTLAGARAACTGMQQS